MTDTHADTTEIFALDDPVETLLSKSYQGEILGEILFGGIAERLQDPDHKHKMQVLATLERRTKEAMVPAMERAGVSLEPEAETVSLAEALVDGSAAAPWLDLMGSFESITTQFLALYAQIGMLNPAEHETADLLVAHELALRAFARMEIAGDAAGSLAAIEALPHLM
jgi:hypothetical protein